jgi:hypothetical protein
VAGSGKYFTKHSTGTKKTHNYLQEELRSKKGPATALPLILATGQTGLSEMSGGQKAYPVYLTFRNISKSVCRKPKKRATVLLGYLPVDGFEYVENDDKRRRMKADLIHRSMEAMLKPLQKASEDGVDMWCADGRMHRIYPMVAAYIADWPEQNLMSCTSEGSCPVCSTKWQGRGDGAQPAPLRDRDETLDAIRAYFNYNNKSELTALSLKPVWPWWAGLPQVKLAMCITPDLLHQLYQGVFKSHVVRWLQHWVGVKKLDQRFASTTQAAGLTHFPRGISHVQQWTGRESKEMLKQTLPLVTGDLTPEQAQLMSSVIDFIFRAHSASMTNTDLDEMDAVLDTFHRRKEIMVTKGFYESSKRFDRLPKLDMMGHYSHSIRELGTPDGYNSEVPEHLHIKYAKDPWRDRINIWHRLYLHHQRLPFAPFQPRCRDVVRASPPGSGGLGGPLKAGVGDTALYLSMSPENPACGIPGICG